jgi:hypothetical protein
MKSSRGIAAFTGAIVLLCAVVAWQWYAHVGGSHAAPQPVQQIAASPAAQTPAASPSPAPVVYVPKTPASPTPAPTATPRAAATVSPVPAAAATASPAATAAPSAGPVVTATPQPYRTEHSVVRDEPMVAATLAPHVVAAKPIAEAPDAPPRIVAMSLSTPVAHGGDVVTGTVETSSNVASVEARIGGYALNMQKTGVGRFVMSYRVPNLPFFLHRTYSIEVIARNTRGDAVRSSLPITIR